MTAARDCGPGPLRSGLRTETGSDSSAFGSIVHVNEKGGCFGGTEEYIALLASELARRGVRSHLVCGLVTGVVPADLSSVHIVDGLASRRPRPGTGDELASVVAGLDPDVIYLHNVFDPAAVSALATLANRGPLIWYVHDHYLTCLSELRWRRDVGSCPQRLGEGCLVAIGEGRCVLRYPERSLGVDELDERLSLSRSLGDADGIVVVSEYMRSLLADAEPHLADRIHLVPRPIRDLGALRSRHRDKPSDPAVITFAGRITPEKGLAVLIEALGGGAGERSDRAAHRRSRRTRRLLVALSAESTDGDGGQPPPERDLPRSPRLPGDRRAVPAIRHRDASRRSGQNPSAPSRSKRCRPGPRSSPRTSAGSTPHSSTATTDYSSIPPTWPPGPRRSSHCSTSPERARQLGAQAHRDVAGITASRPPPGARPDHLAGQTSTTTPDTGLHSRPPAGS